VAWRLDDDRATGRSLRRSVATLVAAGIVAAASALLLAPSLLAIVLPNLAYIAWMVSLDLDDRLPRRLVVVAVLWAPVAVICAVTVQSLLSVGLSAALSSSWMPVIGTTVVAPLTEEPLKAVPVLYAAFRSRAGFRPLNGMAYAGITAFLFAMLEQTLFSLQGDAQGEIVFWDRQYFISTIWFGLGHGLMAGFTALGCAMAHLTSPGAPARVWAVRGLAVAVTVHSLYNAATVVDGLRDAVLVIPVAYAGLVVAFAAALAKVYAQREALLSRGAARG
jgi:RsiW-degrading membrane proteinase PrsW (M82 family)